MASAQHEPDARTRSKDVSIEFGRRSFWRKWFGNRSERAAERFLRRLGWRIVAANVLDRQGELDLVAIDGRTIVFVEVRSVSHEDPQRAVESVNLLKQRKLTDAAVRFLKRRGLLGHAARFDVLAISWPESQRKPTIVHLANAFEPVGRFQFYT